MRRIAFAWIISLGTLAGRALAQAAPDADPAMGDWQGTWTAGPTAGKPLAAQVLALGDGAYRANLIEKFDVRQPPLAVLDGKRNAGAVEFAGTTGQADQAHAWSAQITNGTFAGRVTGPQAGAFELKKTVRLSPTLGEEPPRGAVVLLGPDTKDLQSEWQRDNGQPCGWKLLPEGVMQCAKGGGSVISKRQFGSQRLHVEFRTPFEPAQRGQGRGNSGVYLQGRYEVQVLDSYGLEGANNECGGVYGIAAPAVNMCAPPLQWQTYDISFTAPAVENGKVVKAPRMTVLHNGVKIHDDIEVPRPTAAAPSSVGSATGGLYLQDHGHPVEYRNIWIVEQ